MSLNDQAGTRNFRNVHLQIQQSLEGRNSIVYTLLCISLVMQCLTRSECCYDGRKVGSMADQEE